MSNVSIPCLSTLPVELIHRIFDSLDASIIILSLRITSRRLKAIVDGYNRFTLDFRFISRSNFQLLCHLIDPQKVTSLILAPVDETIDQIDLFISCFRTQKFKRIRSLNLINIKENQLKVILQRFHYSSLTSFSLQLGKRDGRCKSTIATLLSSIMSQANLRYLNLRSQEYQLENITWPVQCTLKYLKISFFNPFNYILMILRNAPHLQTIVITFVCCIHETITQQNCSPTSFQQITSLTLEHTKVDIDTIELLLSLMPSLIHLKLIGRRNYMDGNRWEQFIQTSLLFLNQFELFVHIGKDSDTSVDLNSILKSFQTPFWLEHKWFFTCEHHRNCPESIMLYSIPICVTSLTYMPETRKTCMSTYNPILNNNLSIMDNVNVLELKYLNFTLNDINELIERQETLSNPIFRKVKKLELEHDTDELINWNSFIPTLVDLTTVTEIKITGIIINRAKLSVIDDLRKLIQQACNLTSLDICCEYGRMPKWTAQNICAMVPSHVKHLTTTFVNLKEAEIALEQLQNLVTAKFYTSREDQFSTSIIEWLEQNRTGSSYSVSTIYTNIWFGHKNIPLTSLEVGNKRMKLTDEHHSSH